MYVYMYIGECPTLSIAVQTLCYVSKTLTKFVLISTNSKQSLIGVKQS